MQSMEATRQGVTSILIFKSSQDSLFYNIIILLLVVKMKQVILKI